MSLNQSRVGNHGEDNGLTKSNQSSSQRKKSSFYEASELDEVPAGENFGQKVPKHRPQIETNVDVQEWRSKPPSTIVTPKGHE